MDFNFKIIAIFLLLLSHAMGQFCSPRSADFHRVSLIEGLDEPIELDIAPDGRIFVLERGSDAYVKIYLPSEKRMVTALHLETDVSYFAGGLGLALDPGFETNHWVYIFHTPRVPAVFRLSRYTLAGNTLDSTSRQIMLEFPRREKVGVSNPAGSIAFGKEGTLYISHGDHNACCGFSGGYFRMDERPENWNSDAQGTAGNTANLHGKILRIKPLPVPDHQSVKMGPGSTYIIPPGNLRDHFAALLDWSPADLEKIRPEIFVMGLKCGYRVAANSATGTLFFGEVGPDASEDSPRYGSRGFDYFHATKTPLNMGWPYFTGGRPYRDYDYATGVSGDFWDPDHLENHSPNNTGVVRLPPVSTPLIRYDNEHSEEWPGLTDLSNMGGGNRVAIAGAQYYFDADLNSNIKFPQAYDQNWFVSDLIQGWVNRVELNGDENAVLAVSRLLDSALMRPIDFAFGPDGALYALEYGSSLYSKNKNAGLVRIEYRGGCVIPVPNRRPVPANGQRVKANHPEILSPGGCVRFLRENNGTIQKDRLPGYSLFNLQGTRIWTSAPSPLTSGGPSDPQSICGEGIVLLKGISD